MSATGELSTVKSKLSSYDTKLTTMWTSDEVPYYQQAANNEKSRISGINDDISNLSSSISQAYDDIRREEEAAAAAAAAAAAKAAKAASTTTTK